MNQFNFIEVHAVATLPIAWMAGYAIGFLLWLLRYLMLEFPHSGRLRKGGVYKS